MKPELFSYSKTNTITELSVYPMQVKDLLDIFDNSLKITFVDFGATCYKNYGWVDQQQFPEIKILKDVAKLLKEEGDIGIIIFHVDIENICSVLINDKKTIFQFSNDQNCNHYLKQISYNAGGNLLVNAIKSNKGQYIHCTLSGDIEKYSDTEHYLNKNV